MWEFLKYYILFFFFDYEVEEENTLSKEKTDLLKNDQYFLINKKKIIGIILILIFLLSWGYFFSFQIFTFEKNIWTELKNYTDKETFNEIFQHVQNIYEDPYYRQKGLNYLRYIQLTNIINNTENSIQLKDCIEKLIDQIEKDFKDIKKYTSYN